MIKLNYLSSESVRCVDLFDWAITSAEDTQTQLMDIVEPEYLSEDRGIFGENYVSHLKIDGTISYDIKPLIIVPDPSPQYPDRVFVTRSEYPSDPINFGSAYAGRVSRYYSANLGIMYVSAIRALSNNLWVIRTYNVDLRYPTRLGYSLLERTVTSITLGSTYATVTYDQRSWLTNETGINLTALQADAIFSLGSGTPVTTLGKVNAAARIYHNYVGDIVLSPSVAKAKIDTLVGSLIPGLSKAEDIEAHYGELAAEAVETFDFVNINMISFISELRDPKSLIPKLKNLSALKEAKTYADLFLSGKYGVLPTISDLHEIVAAFNKTKPFIDKNGFRALTAGRTSNISTPTGDKDIIQRIKIALSNEARGFLALSDGLDSIGLMPNLKNLWDLVPYSFVLDWFIDVGDYLGAVDSRMRIDTLDIKYVTMSRKVTYDHTLEPTLELPLSGTIQLVHYHRWVSGHCPVPPLSLVNTGNPTRHWLEGSALFIQRAKF